MYPVSHLTMGSAFPFARYFGDINILAELQLQGRSPLVQRPPRDPAPKDLLLYLGCNVLRTAHIAETAVQVLQAMGFDFNAVGGPAYCCGIIHHRAGAREASRAYTANSLRHFGAYAPTQVVMWCPSCVEHYDGVVAGEHDLGFPYEHMTAFVARHLDRIRFVNRIERTVALHYHTGHPRQDLDWSSARTVLGAIPGLRYVEIPNPAALGRHCSPAYIDAVGRPRWQGEVTRIAQAAAAAGADTLATIYHSCHREICHEEGRHPVAIVNYITLLAEAMGLETAEDWYKRHRLAADPERTFEEVRPYVEARGLDPARVREALVRAFAPACAARPTGPS